MVFQNVEFVISKYWNSSVFMLLFISVKFIIHSHVYKIISSLNHSEWMKISDTIRLILVQRHPGYHSD